MAADTNDKKYYDSSATAISQAELRAHCSVVQKYISRYENRLRTQFQGRQLKTLELGAGSCMTSLILSKLEAIKHIACLDISLKKMQEMLPTSAKVVTGCVPEKLSLMEGRFDLPLPFENSSVDVVVFDGALHHARSMWFLLEECRRVLAPGGVLIAQREQYLGVLTAATKLKNLLNTEEVRAGVSENAFLKSQYEYYLRATGFGSVEFISVAETNLQMILSLANGWLFSKWVIWARPQ